MVPRGRFEPLPYVHRNADLMVKPWACTMGEDPTQKRAIAAECPGCIAWLMSQVLRNPEMRLRTLRGGRVAAIARLRQWMSADDPKMVMFERMYAVALEAVDDDE